MASNSATHNIPVVEGKWAGRLPEHRLIQPFVVSDWQNERISDAVANEVGRITRTQWNAYKDNHQIVTEVEDIIRGLGKKRYLRLKHKDWCEIMDEYYSRNPEDETKVSTDEAKKKTGDEKTVTDEEKAAAKKKKAQNFMLHVRKSRLKCRDILALCEIFPGKEIPKVPWMPQDGPLRTGLP